MHEESQVRRQSSTAAQAGAAQAEAAADEQLDTLIRAMSAGLEGRGYTVLEVDGDKETIVLAVSASQFPKAAIASSIISMSSSRVNAYG
jgi:hypothetical protein